MQRAETTAPEARERAITAAVAACRRGDLVLVPTESAYALATDAFSARGRAAMREAKDQDPRVPLPVMVPSAATVPGLATLDDDARALMAAFWPGLLTLLLPAQSTLAWDVPGGTPIAIRMPLHPLLLALLQRTGPLVVTGANAPGQDAPMTIDDAVTQLGDVCTLALDAGPLEAHEPSTIVDASSGTPVLRRAGGVSLDALRQVCPAITAHEAAG